MSKWNKHKYHLKYNMLMLMTSVYFHTKKK